MPAGHRDLLKSFGLSRNPFTDRTAEKTTLDGIAHYNHSDLQGFAPSGRFFVVLRSSLMLVRCSHSHRTSNPSTLPHVALAAPIRSSLDAQFKRW